MSGASASASGFTRRLAVVVAAVLVPALLAGWAIQALGTREALAAQQSNRNQDAATLLAMALAAAGGDAATEDAALQSQAVSGRYRRLSLTVGTGVPRVDLARAQVADGVPAWFASRALAGVRPGVVSFGDPARELRVELHDDAAVAALWRATLATAAMLAAVVAGAALVLAWSLRTWRVALQTTVAQAQAIEQARFVTADEPSIPELRDMTRAMNAMVRRLRELFDAQAEQVARLQQQVQTDAVCGLPVRAQFMDRLGDALIDPAGAPAALLLVRVPNLERLNEVHGREATDRLLGALGDVLLTYVERVPGACAGRLNGTDFALCLPASGIARETAESLRGALEASPAARLAGAEFLVGACDGLRGIAAGAALASADAALAAAESGDGIAVVDRPQAAPGGARAWREQIADALAHGRAQIGAYAVVNARGELVHLECPLRVQLEAGGDFLEARRWLSLAARSRLMHEVDLAAVGLALAAIAADGRPRCVHVAPRSFASPEFAATLLSRLQAAGAAARRLAIEWTEGQRTTETTLLRAAIADWRALGVAVGVEHAGASPKALPSLKGLGVDYVKVDARHLRGLAADEAVRGYAQSLVALIHGLGLQAVAEGIDDPADLLAVWGLGFDAATGSAVPTPAA